MKKERLFHGANGDKILSIIDSGEMRPDEEGRVFFARDDWASVFMHGADTKRRAAFAVQASVSIPDGAVLQRLSTQGVQNTVVVMTTKPLPVEIFELFVRERPGEPIVRIAGKDTIVQYLKARQGPRDRSGHE